MRSDIAIGICSLFAVYIYFHGVQAWKETLNKPEDIVAAGKRIYFISFSSAVYAGTLVGVIMADRFWPKVFTRGLNSVFAVVLFEEIKHGDQQWSFWTYWLPAVFLVNYFVLYATIDKIKKMRNDGG